MDKAEGCGWQIMLLRWSQTAYGLIHGVSIAEKSHFGNINELGSSIQESFTWFSRTDQFVSNVNQRNSREDDFKMSSDDAITCITDLKWNLLGLLLVDLATVTDEILACIMESYSIKIGDYQYLRNKANAVRCDLKQKWAQKGVLELNVIRNCFIHNQGRWSNKGLTDIGELVTGRTAKEGDRVAVNFEDIFRYKRAVRTLINQAHLNGFNQSRAISEGNSSY